VNPLGLNYVNEGAGKSGREQCPVCGSDDPGKRHKIAVAKTGPDPEQRHGYSPVDYLFCGNVWHDLPTR
jgi:hypothetical protein